ncbi:MAG: TolC family protein [Leptolyngbyaceae cyanobacterium]
MPHPWLIRFKFSAAIALPSMSLLWLALPTRAVESPHQHLPETTQLAQSDAPAQPGYIASEASTPDRTVASSEEQDAAGNQNSVSGPGVGHTSSTIHPLTPVVDVAPPFLETSPPNPVTLVEGQPLSPSRDVVSPALGIEPPQTEVLFSDENPVPWGSTLTVASEEEGPTAAPIKAAPAIPPAAESLPISLLGAPIVATTTNLAPASSAATQDAIANAPASLSASPQQVETTSPEVLFSQVDPTEPEDSAAPSEDDETFSPLPDPDPEPAEDPNDPTVPEVDAPSLETPADEADQDIEDEIEDDIEDEIEDVEDVTPAEDFDPPLDVPADEAVPIPVDRVADELQYLDPDPNPLLIQTEPEEVEIIGQQPITLEQAVELAYRNNPDLQVALLELEQSQAVLRETQAALLPTVSVNGTLQGQNVTETDTSTQTIDVLTPTGTVQLPIPGATSTSEELGASVSAQVNVNYELFSSGQRAASIRAAEEQVRFDELDVELIQEDLRLTTATNYYNLQIAIESIRINEAFLEEAERNLRDTILREDVGVGTRFDVLRAEVQAADARQDLVNAQRDRQVAERTLASTLNLPPSLTIDTVPVEVAGEWPLTLEESIVQAYQNRAELEQQLVLRDLNEQQRRFELGALGPQVDLFATYSTSDIITQDGGFDDNYSFGAQVSWLLFDGGAARARARQNELDIEIAERTFEDARAIIRLSVEDAYFNLQSNLTNIETARLSVEQAGEALRLANLRFDAGVGTQLEILDAQSDLTDAEVNLVQAIVGYNQSLADIERAISNIPEPFYLRLPY